ncbi:MAG: hypothetical protein AAGF71_02355 [Pseudomonadota bacterium]
MDLNAFLECLAAPGDKWGCFREHLGGPGLFVFLAAWAGYFWCDRHLNRTDNIPLATWLRNDTIGSAYKRGLTRALDWFDSKLCPSENLDTSDPRYRKETEPTRAWNWLAYVRMFMFAAMYPLVSLVVVWVFSGNAQWVGTIPMIPKSDSTTIQIAVAGLILGVIFTQQLLRWVCSTFVWVFTPVGYDTQNLREPKKREILLVRLALASIATVALAGAVAGAVAVAVVGVVAGVVAGAFAGRQQK